MKEINTVREQMEKATSYTIEAQIPAEIRQSELVEDTFKNSKGEDQPYSYIVIKALDDNDNSFFLKDKEIGRLPLYKRGTVGTIKVRIHEEFGFQKRKTKMEVVGFEPTED